MTNNLGDWNTFEKLYKNSKGNYDSILAYVNGIKYLKLRTISKGIRIKAFAKEKHIVNSSSLSIKKLLPLCFEQSTEKEIEDFINKIYTKERKDQKTLDEKLYSELTKVKNVDWGGVRQNNLETSIVNIVKATPNYDDMMEKIKNSIILSTEGWAISNWYSFWSNDVIENLIKDHKKILPGIGDIKHIDFFWDNVPMDLKSSKFAAGFIQEKRRKNKLKTEFSVIKKYANEQKINFDRTKTDTIIEKEIMETIKISNNQSWNNFIQKNIYDIRKKILCEAIDDPTEYAIWNYTNQGEARFGDENRFFLILIDKETTDTSWKLKREIKFMREKINQFLDRGLNDQLLRNIHFSFGGKNYVGHCCILFIIEE